MCLHNMPRSALVESLEQKIAAYYLGPPTSTRRLLPDQKLR